MSQKRLHARLRWKLTDSLVGFDGHYVVKEGRGKETEITGGYASDDITLVEANLEA